MGRFCMAALLAAAAACGGKRTVGAPANPAAATTSTIPGSRSPVPGPRLTSDPNPDPHPDPHPHPHPHPHPAPDPDPDPDPGAAPPRRPAAEPDLTSLTEPTRVSDRRREFARAVAAISQALGAPIAEDKALADMPCGGWSGPDCSNLTVGIEIAKTCAPIVASFHRQKTADIAGVLAEAISVHSIWHDAYGYVWRTRKKGPGYTYAGCLFSSCEPGNLRNGQVDGILYQVGRLIGAIDGPACGPGCTLPM